MGLKILTAEDEVYMNELYRDTLESLGHQIITTDSAEKCLSAYKHTISDHLQPFDVLILDFLMPGKDGVTLAKEILAENPKQKIIFISAHGSLLSKKIGELKGDIALLSKPVSLLELAAKIEGSTIEEVTMRLKK